MDAQAHLLALGWAGPGHALDSRPYKQKGHRGLAYDPNEAAKFANTGNGLVKPLLISQRKSRFGIGKKAHEPQAGNEWWLKGFQSALDNIGKSESERSSGTNTPVHNSYHGKHIGLYGYFQKGQVMQGTIEEETSQRKKRKSDMLDDDADGRTTVRDPLAVLPVSREKTAEELEKSIAFLATCDKDRKRKEKPKRGTDAEQFAVIGDFLGATGREKQKKQKHNSSQASQEETSGISLPREQLNAESRNRRKKRKAEEGQFEKSLADMVKEELAKLESEGTDDPEDAVAKAARRAERKRRKAEKAEKAVATKK